MFQIKDFHNGCWRYQRKQIQGEHNARYVLSQLMEYNGLEHECSCEVQDAYSPLFRREAEETDEPVFVDGSRYCISGEYFSGYAIWFPKRGYAIQHRLPGHF